MTKLSSDCQGNVAVDSSSRSPFLLRLFVAEAIYLWLEPFLFTSTPYNIVKINTSFHCDRNCFDQRTLLWRMTVRWVTFHTPLFAVRVSKNKRVASESLVREKRSVEAMPLLRKERSYLFYYFGKQVWLCFYSIFAATPGASSSVFTVKRLDLFEVLGFVEEHIENEPPGPCLQPPGPSIVRSIESVRCRQATMPFSSVPLCGWLSLRDKTWPSASSIALPMESAFIISLWIMQK